MKTKENINVEVGEKSIPEEYTDFYQQFAANTSDVFAIYTPEAHLLFINDQFEIIFKRDKKEIGNNIQKFLEWIHPEDLERIKKQSYNFSDFNFFEASLRFRIILPNGDLSWL